MSPSQLPLRTTVTRSSIYQDSSLFRHAADNAIRMRFNTAVGPHSPCHILAIHSADLPKCILGCKSTCHEAIPTMQKSTFIIPSDTTSAGLQRSVFPIVTDQVSWNINMCASRIESIPRPQQENALHNASLTARGCNILCHQGPLSSESGFPPNDNG